MKISANMWKGYLIVLTAAMCLATRAESQDITHDTITLGLRHETLEAAIRKIESATVFRFLYRKGDVEPVTGLVLPEAGRTVAATLSEMLQKTNLTFRQVGRNILLEQKSNSETHVIRGRVTGFNRQPVQYAALTVYTPDSHLPKLAATADSAGVFMITVSEKGNYLLGVSAVGMDSAEIAVTVNSAPVAELPDIMLAPGKQSLKDVVVSGRKALVEQKIDRTVVNVGAFISNTGANALEVLEKSPGVVVDANGNISLKGKAGVLLLIDGKPTYLSGSDLAAYLRSIPASSLDQIELMDNPPAKYDAAGDAGVINIKTKKSKTAGFNGALSASAGQAHYPQASESLNLNYHAGKVNLFANASYGISHIYRQLNLDRDYFDGSGQLSSQFKQVQYINARNNSTNIKAGMDYYPIEKTTWGVVFTGNFSPGVLDVPSTNNLYDNKGALDSTVVAGNTGRSRFASKGVNLNYGHQFDSLGQAVTFDIDYLQYQSGNRQNFLNRTYDAAGNLADTQQLADDLPTSIHIYTAKADYSKPFNTGGRFEAGVKTSYVNTDNAANYFDVEDGAATANYSFSNDFLYRENINAAYLNINKPARRFEFQAGIRLENTNASGHQPGNPMHADSSFQKHYTSLFPTAYLSYKLDGAGRHLLSASYGRRIGRPYYQDLNPFILPSDKFTYSAGNPYLRPQFAGNFKLAYSYKNIFSTAIFYNHVADLQNEVIRQQGSIFIDGTGNIGTAMFWGFSANAGAQATPWWLFNAYVQAVHNHFKGQLPSGYLDRASTYCQLNITTQFTLPKGWSAELSGFYTSRFADGQSETDPFGQVNAGIQKKILHNNGALKLSGRDLLHTYRADGITYGINNAVSNYRNRFNSQAFTIGFSYTFSAGAGTRQKRETGGAESEKNRVRK